MNQLEDLRGGRQTKNDKSPVCCRFVGGGINSRQLTLPPTKSLVVRFWKSLLTTYNALLGKINETAVTRKRKLEFEVLFALRELTYTVAHLCYDEPFQNHHEGL